MCKFPEESTPPNYGEGDYIVTTNNTPFVVTWKDITLWMIRFNEAAVSMPAELWEAERDSRAKEEEQRIKDDKIANGKVG